MRWTVWDSRIRRLRWLGTCVFQSLLHRLPYPGRNIHLLLCVADHYEPNWDGASTAQAQARVDRWLSEYPGQFAGFRDSDGRRPRHTFFYPAEEYVPEHLDALAELCKAGYGEVEIHLHHDNDTPESLRQQLLQFRDVLANRHGLLGRTASGEPKYAFIHGNWALCNARSDGQRCGVDNEIPILLETGCYADLTYPSAPDDTQPPQVNQLYYASDVPGRKRSHEVGIAVGKGLPPQDGLLMIQGPLVLDWLRRKWFVVPRLENGCLQGSQPPSLRRIWNWLRAGVRHPHRPDWYFVKLHCHGCIDRDTDMLLGPPMRQLHEELTLLSKIRPEFHFHYLTARELYNLIQAAEAGWTGSVIDAVDSVLKPAPVSQSSRKKAPRWSLDLTEEYVPKVAKLEI